MNHSLITLSRKDSDFLPYLLGKTANKVAVPMQSLNINTESETVTFKVLDKSDIQKPNFLVVLSRVFKASQWNYILFPMFLVLTKNIVDGTFSDQETGLLSLFAALFLFIAMNLRNEFVDHMTGVDRVHPQGPHKPIQLGWVRAYQVRNLSVVFFIFGILLGLPAVIKYQTVLMIVGPLTILGMFFSNYHRRLIKYERAGEVVVFLLLGPLLTVGFEVACGGVGVSDETIFLGFIFGWFALFHIHLKNFEALIFASQARLQNSVARLGFEKSKKFLLIFWLLFLVGFNAYQFIYSPVFWHWILLFASLLSSTGFLAALRHLQSPVGSGVARLMHDAKYMSVFVMAFWLVENLWYLYVAQ